jgi:hypothetical protein
LPRVRSSKPGCLERRLGLLAVTMASGLCSNPLSSSELLKLPLRHLDRAISGVVTSACPQSSPEARTSETTYTVFEFAATVHQKTQRWYTGRAHNLLKLGRSALRPKGSECREAPPVHVRGSLAASSQRTVHSWHDGRQKSKQITDLVPVGLLGPPIRFATLQCHPIGTPWGPMGSQCMTPCH